MGFSQQEYCSGLPFLLQEIFPTLGSNLHLLNLQVDSLPLSHQGSPRATEPPETVPIFKMKEMSLGDQVHPDIQKLPVQTRLQFILQLSEYACSNAGRRENQEGLSLF